MLCIPELRQYTYHRNCANGVGSASRSRASGTTPTTVNNNGWLAAAAAAEEGEEDLNFAPIGKFEFPAQSFSWILLRSFNDGGE